MAWVELPNLIDVDASVKSAPSATLNLRLASVCGSVPPAQTGIMLPQTRLTYLSVLSSESVLESSAKSEPKELLVIIVAGSWSSKATNVNKLES